MKSDSTSITIQWNTIEQATSYDVHFRICSTPPFTWDHAATITGCAVKKKGLQANTKYEFRVRSSSSTSASESSSSDSIHSIWSVPSLPIATLADFNPFKQLLGTTLINSKNKSVSIDLLTGKKLIMLYFSASWCPPCRQFTPMLAKFYNEMKSKGRSLEIIFVSADRDVTSFTEYMTNEHPWHLFGGTAGLMNVVPDTTPLALHWWKAVPNFGDAISPVVLAHVSGRQVVHAGVSKADIWAIGSLLQVVKRSYSDAQERRPVIWGTGLLHPVHGIGFIVGVK